MDDLRYMLLDYRCAATEHAEYYCQLVEDFVAAKDTRIATLEALIADAPHEEWCNVVLTGPRQDCDCWKSSALDTGAKV